MIASLSSNISAELSGIRLLSLDIFDTLLIRLVPEPEDVFDLIGILAKQERVLPEWMEAGAFRSIRQEAAHRAYLQVRESGRADPFLHEIYSHMSLLIDDVGAAQAIELQAETSLLRANPIMFDVMRESKIAGIEIALCSDMYFSAEQLAELLDRCGIEREMYDHLLVSSDIGHSKSAGGLFEELLSRSPRISPSEILHIGDNPVSDVESARKHGLQALHYTTFRGSFSQREIHERFFGNLGLGAIVTARKLAVSGVSAIDHGSAWIRLGAEVTGPFVTLFAEWVVRNCLSLDIRRICPLMRDAHVLAPAIRFAAQRLGAVNLEVVPAYISRRSSCLAEFLRPDTAAVERWLGLSITTGAFFKRLGISLPIFLECYESMPLSMLRHECLTNGESVIEFLVSYFNQPDIRDMIISSLSNEHALLSDYVRQLAGSHQTIALIDYSHNASIGHAIHQLSKSGAAMPNICSMITFGDVDVIAKEWMAGHSVRCYMGGPGRGEQEVKKICEKSALIEELFFGMEGTTTGYSRNANGEVSPILEHCPFSPEELENRALCQSGMQLFQTTWNTLNPSDSPDEKQISRMLLRLIELPTPDEANLLGKMRVDRGFGDSPEILVCPDSARMSLERDGTRVFLRNASNFDSSEYVYWPEGVVAQYRPAELLSERTFVNSNDSLFRFYLRALQAVSLGARSVCIHGAKQAGRVATEAARWAGLEVLALADRDPLLIGQEIEGVTVVSHEEAAAKDPDVVIIASFVMSESIRCSLEAIYPRDKPLLIP
jgi:FMN phosphatase YigB (HAD superfamily)